jgi:hypothetical protein
MNRWDELDEQSKRKTIVFLVFVGLALLWLTWPASPAPGTSKRMPVRTGMFAVSRYSAVRS